MFYSVWFKRVTTRAGVFLFTISLHNWLLPSFYRLYFLDTIKTIDQRINFFLNNFIFLFIVPCDIFLCSITSFKSSKVTLTLSLQKYMKLCLPMFVLLSVITTPNTSQDKSTSIFSPVKLRTFSSPVSSSTKRIKQSIVSQLKQWGWL